MTPEARFHYPQKAVPNGAPAKLNFTNIIHGKFRSYHSSRARGNFFPVLVDFNAVPCWASPPRSVISAGAVGVTPNFVAQLVQQIQLLPELAGPQGSKAKLRWRKIKVSQLWRMALQVHRESREIKKRLWFNDDVSVWTSFPTVIWFFFLFLSVSVRMRSGHPCLSPRLSAVLWTAVWRSLVTMPYHASGTAQGFIEPQSREIWTNQICANMPRSLLSFFFLCLSKDLNAFCSCFFIYLSISNPISFSITMLQKELRCTGETCKLDSCLETHLQPFFVVAYSKETESASHAITIPEIKLFMLNIKADSHWLPALWYCDTFINNDEGDLFLIETER